MAAITMIIIVTTVGQFLIMSFYNYVVLYSAYDTYVTCFDAYTYVTGFWKTDRIVKLGPFHFIGPANGYNCMYTTHSQCHYHGWLIGLLF